MATRAPFAPSADLLRRFQSGLNLLFWTFLLFFFASCLKLFTWYSFSFLELIGSIIGFSGAAKLKNIVVELREPHVRAAHQESTPRASEVIRAAAHTPAFSAQNVDNEWERTPEVQKREEKKEHRRREKSMFETIDWEQWIGKKLLQKLGVLIVLVGMVVFLKYSFDNHIIGELGRIALSVVAAIAFLCAGEWFQKKYPLWAHAFTGGGLALLYFTIWAAHVFYHQELLDQHGLEVTSTMAMGLYSLITFVGALAAIRYRAQTIAWFTVLGGYLTPFLIQTADPNPVSLTVYLGILAVGLLALSWFQKWRYLQFAAFMLTQIYLFSLVYPTAVITDLQQVMIAIGFFVLFGVLPLLYQFRLRRAVEGDDLLLILANGAAGFLAVVDGMGGFGGDYVGFVSLVLATVYVALAAAALSKRSDDDVLVNTYLLAGIGLMALALFAQLKTEWVVAGWAPFSVLLVFVAVRLRKKSIFACAGILLVGALYFLAVNLQVLLVFSDVQWHPFTSHWALLNDIVLLSLIGWVWATKAIDKALYVSGEFMMNLVTGLHTVMATLLFAAVTFEATQLRWEITLTVAFAYLAFALCALLIFLATASLVWFIAALFGQALVLLFTFFLSQDSGMLLTMNGVQSVTPFLHPWAAVSAASVGSLLIILRVVMQKKEWMGAGTLRTCLIATIMAQLWVHGTVEIQHMHMAYYWSDVLFHRILSGWWIVFSIPFFYRGLSLQKSFPLNTAIALLCIPLTKDLFRMIAGNTDLYELALWSAIPLLLLVGGLRWKEERMILSAAGMIVATMAADVVQGMGSSVPLFSIGWWTVGAFLFLGTGVWKKNIVLVRVGIGLMLATMAVDMLLNGEWNAGFLPTSWWTFIALVFIAIGLQKKERLLLPVGLGMIVATILSDQSRMFATDAGVLRTIWWTIVGLVVMSAGFFKREKMLRLFAICLFGAAVVKLMIFDFAELSTGVRIGASILTGFLLIGASWLYQRFDALLSHHQ